MIMTIPFSFKMRVSEPYLLLRNYKNETTGVWFYSKDEQQKISQTVKALIEEKTAAKKDATKKGEKAAASQVRSLLFIIVFS